MSKRDASSWLDYSSGGEVSAVITERKGTADSQQRAKLRAKWWFVIVTWKQSKFPR
jgi:hypothetical protein